MFWQRVSWCTTVAVCTMASNLTLAAVILPSNCRHGFEFSVYLAPPVFKNRIAAMEAFEADLGRAEGQFAWFKLYPDRARPIVDEATDYLDTENSTFASQNIQVRFRRLIGTNIGITDLVLRDAPVEESPQSSDQTWKPFAHCHTEESVYSNDHLANRPDYIGNISTMFPWISHVIGYDQLTVDTTPLHVVKNEYRWLKYYDMHFNSEPHPTRISAAITLQYETRADMEVYQVEPSNAVFGWRTMNGTESWKQNERSQDLVSWLASTSPYANKTYLRFNPKGPFNSGITFAYRLYQVVACVLLISIGCLLGCGMSNRFGMLFNRKDSADLYNELPDDCTLWSSPGSYLGI